MAAHACKDGHSQQFTILFPVSALFIIPQLTQSYSIKKTVSVVCAEDQSTTKYGREPSSCPIAFSPLYSGTKRLPRRLKADCNLDPFGVSRHMSYACCILRLRISHCNNSRGSRMNQLVWILLLLKVA